MGVGWDILSELDLFFLIPDMDGSVFQPDPIPRRPELSLLYIYIYRVEKCFVREI